MNSMNIISTTGRIPIAAAPTPAPRKAISEIGVSITRDSPNFSIRPSVALKGPPDPISSPIRNTFGSLSISSESASITACRVRITVI